MKIYGIYDTEIKDKTLAYIFYFEREENWYIEIPKDIDEWELPCILEHFVRNGKYTVPPYWAREFVRARIVPPDRQNLGLILKNEKLDHYDEFALLECSKGYCSMDNCYIKKLKETDVPGDILSRNAEYIETIVGAGFTYMITLKNGEIVYIDLKKTNNKDFDKLKDRLSKYESLFKECGGVGISYGKTGFISAKELKEIGTVLPFNSDLLKEYSKEEIISTSDVMRMLNCTRQNVDDMVKKGKLHPIDAHSVPRMFYRSELNV